MDGRILIKNTDAVPHTSIAELADWKPGAATLHSEGRVTTTDGVSLIVPTFFNSRLKARSLRSLLAGVTESACIREIILISSDGEETIFNDLHEHTGERPIRVIQSDPHNRGKSRNAGAAAASWPHLLFLDDDMLLRHWRSIDVLLSHLLENDYDCALFPRRHYVKFPLLFDPPGLQSAISIWRDGGGTDRNPFLYDPLASGARDLPMLFCFPGCFMLIRREAYQRMNGFTEEFIGWGFEDTDFGLRAMRELRVLNLFRRGEPLLHIDHPTSPYKSDEHNANFRKFYSSSASVDVNLFCRRVFRGEDFVRENGALSREQVYTQPFRVLAERGVPVGAEKLGPWSLALASQRQSRHLSPLPRFVLLHGSRSQNSGQSGGDYDVLALYHGHVQEFFVTHTEPRVEIECADLYRFEHIAEHPAIHSFQGPMELAKIADAHLLWGDAAAWHEWSIRLIRGACDTGSCFWLVLGLGLRWQASKYGPMVDRYFRSLQKLLGCAAALNGTQLNGHANFSDESLMIDSARDALAQRCPDWRERVDRGENIFELQVPEVWIALHRLRASSKRTNGSKRPFVTGVKRKPTRAALR
jgi:glycosyltransferase involved in cell wall biosynthesis